MHVVCSVFVSNAGYMVTTHVMADNHYNKGSLVKDVLQELYIFTECLPESRTLQSLR